MKNSIFQSSNNFLPNFGIFAEFLPDWPVRMFWRMLIFYLATKGVDDSACISLFNVHEFFSVKTWLSKKSRFFYAFQIDQ